MQKRRVRHVVAALAVAALVPSLLWLATRQSGIAELMTRLELSAYDGILFGIRGRLPTPKNVVVVAIDPRSCAADEHGAWPFPRALHAELIRRLHAWGAKVIAFDVVFDLEREDDPQGDQQLVAACREAGNVLMAAQLSQADFALGENEADAGDTDIMTLRVPFAALQEVVEIGLVNFAPEVDGMVRRAEVFHQAEALTDLTGQAIPLLSIAAAARYHGDDPAALAVDSTLRLGHRAIPLEEERSLWINYAGEAGTIRNFYYYQVVPADGGPPLVPTDAFRDALVFVGATDPLLHDDVSTPWGDKFPGVEVHANVANTLLNSQPIRRLPDWWSLLLAFVMAAGVGSVTVTRRPTAAAVYLVFGLGAYGLLAVLLFERGGIWIPLVLPPIGAIVAYTLSVLYRYLVEERERRKISALFSKYVSKDVARELIEDENAARLGNSRKLFITCLFSDIRGFTTLSERLEPQEVVGMLNDYFDRMVDVVFEQRGTLDKYVGDAIMATFGVPKSFGNDAERACRTAVRMREELAQLQRQWAAEGKSGIDIGIGIHTGDAVVGNIGHHDRLEFTCIGDTINTASRLEGLNKELGTKVLISEATYAQVKELGLFSVRELPPATVKGKSEAVRIYELLGWAPETKAEPPALSAVK